jgi:outer membrane receptor for ferrienterochelin and colicins
VPSQRAAAGLRWRDGGQGLDGNLEGAVTGGRPYYLDPDDVQAETRTDVRFDLRARVAKTFDQRLTFFVGVDNILDAGDETYDPIAPRTFYLGAVVRQ